MRQRLTILFLSIACSVAAQDKPKAEADNAQEAAVIDHMVTRAHFENDGTGFIEHSRVIHIQSEAGIQLFGQLVFGYSSATESLRVNYVRVRKPNGQIIETPESGAQDFAPEVLQSVPMYSDFRERHVTVAGLRPGDVLEFKTTKQITTSLAPGEFWFEYSFPTHIAAKKVSLEIDVPKNRDVKVKSPKRNYATAEAGDRRTYTWVVENLAPDRKEQDEDTDQSEEDDDFPDVQLTTFKNWQAVALWYAKLQGERVVVDDTIKRKAAELTRGAITTDEKARRIYDFVARDIRYVSLSFGVGRYQPHASIEVLAGSYGDCKDKHTLLSALLRAAGISSYPVLIGSDRKLDEDIPSPAQFDHVITLAEIDKDQVWLDSTAEVAPYGLLVYPLRDKQAVLATDDTSGGLRRTPASVPVKNRLALTLNGKISPTGAMDATVDIVATGDSAVPFRMIFRSTSQADWQKIGERLAFLERYRGKVSAVEVTELEEPAKPLHIRYKLQEDTFFQVPSSDVAWYIFPPAAIGRLPKKKAGKPLDIGPALEMHNKAHLEFASNYTVKIPPEVAIVRDYGQYSISYTLTKNVLEADQTYIVTANQLPAARRPDVESLRSVAVDYVRESITCDVRAAANEGTVIAAAAGTNPQELRKAGLKALSLRDFKNASALLKRVVDLKPDSEDAWDELGQAYAGLGSHANAIAAYRKQVEVNPFNKRAYNDLGAELRLAGKYEDALAAYGKQLDNVPVDNTARKNHGLVLLELKRNPEAMADLEKASAAMPDDPEIELALAQLYFGTGQQEKSRALMLSVTGSLAPAAGGDWFSAALRDDINPDQTVNDARKIVDGISDQFDAGVYDQSPPAVFSAMYLVALEWARIGWAQFLKGDKLEAIRYLEAAWSLSQSGTVANRLARIYEKTGDTTNVRHMLLLATSAGGAEAATSRAQLAKTSTARLDVEVAHAQAELEQMRTVKVRGLQQKSGQADFVLVFDGSSRPQRVDYRQGDPELRGAEAMLTDGDYPVSFPENSSLKIVREGALSCSAQGCTLSFKLLESVQVPQIAQK